METIQTVNSFTKVPSARKLNALANAYIMDGKRSERFKPAENMESAFLVINEMSKLGYRFLLKQCSKNCGIVARGQAQEGDYFCNMIQDSDDIYGQSKSTSIYTAFTPALAVCLSALQALGIKL